MAARWKKLSAYETIDSRVDPARWSRISIPQSNESSCAVWRPLHADRPDSALAVAAALPGGDPLAAALAAGETPVASISGRGWGERRPFPPCWIDLRRLALLGLAPSMPSEFRSAVSIAWIFPTVGNPRSKRPATSRSSWDIPPTPSTVPMDSIMTTISSTT